MATEISCKSDCYFSQNYERKCNLKDIQMVQEEPFTPKLACSQYVPAQISQQTKRQVDIDKAMSFGMARAMERKIG